VNIPPAHTDLLLIGGGHSHCLALRMLAMQPIPGVRITLVSSDPTSAYSGMLPGLIAGHYAPAETQVDLYRLCLATGARFVHASVTSLAADQHTVQLSDGSTLGYDWLSLDVGATPDLSPVGDSHPRVLAVKPVATFWKRWQQWRNHADKHHLAVVGGGAGGTEMVLAMAEYCRQQQRPVTFSLLTGGTLLPGYGAAVQARMRRHLQRYNIQLQEHTRVTRADNAETLLANDQPLAADGIVWCTGVRGIPVVANSSLACDAQGFVKVDAQLRSLSHPRVFATGDCAAFPSPLPKAGVYAVRQAGVLAHNLRAAITEAPLKPYRPQRHFLSLLSTGDKQAVASRTGLPALSGKFVWRWKDRIDRRFMDKFGIDLPTMSATPSAPSSQAMPLHCAGCGAKVGSQALSDALADLQPHRNAGIHAGVDTADDAAVIDWPAGQRLVQSLDHFPAFVDEPYRFGRIAALHSLSDLYAMNARPHSALANITVNWHHPKLQGRDLQRLMAGAVRELNRAGCTLVGGHTTEGPQMAAGFTVNGSAPADVLWHKRGAQPDDVIILTKPLGSGVQLAAMMHGNALRSPWLAATLDNLLLSNGPACDAMGSLPVHACTDITGFGLLGHLHEICQQSDVSMTLDTDKIPLLPGTLTLIQEGIASTLSDTNRQILMHCQAHERVSEALKTALCDPQTSGGLVFCLPAAMSEHAQQQLAQNGVKSAVIGKVLVKNRHGDADIFLQ